MAYKVTLKPKAIKVLIKIDEPFYSRIKTAIYSLADNPRPHGCKSLKGRSGYRIRIGDYQVIYEIFDAVLLVDVVEVGNRKDIYD